MAGVYRLVLDGQLLCLAVDQRPNNSSMRGTLPESSCHPVLVGAMPNNNRSDVNGVTNNHLSCLASLV